MQTPEQSKQFESEPFVMPEQRDGAVEFVDRLTDIALHKSSLPQEAPVQSDLTPEDLFVKKPVKIEQLSLSEEAVRYLKGVGANLDMMRKIRIDPEQALRPNISRDDYRLAA